MIVNLVGECDKRPIIYTLMKVFQTLGDVLLLTSDHRLLRLSDTRENGGHYQNVMIAYTIDGVDDFLEEFPYDLSDFTHVIIDNLVAGQADVTIFCHGLVDSDLEKDAIEYVDDVQHIELYKGKGVQGTTMYACERFEAMRNMPPIHNTCAMDVAKIMHTPLNTSEANITKIAMSPPLGSEAVKSKVKKSPFRGGAKGGKKKK